MTKAEVAKIAALDDCFGRLLKRSHAGRQGGGPNSDTRPVKTAAEQQLIIEVKRLYLRNSLRALAVATDPTMLWNAILEFRYQHHVSTGVEDDESVSQQQQQYGDLRLTYEGYRKVAYQCIFNPPGQALAEKEQHDEKQKQQVYFTHPFLSPQTFLFFPRDEVGAVPAVQLYAYVAKKLLLFRLRVLLELAATVPPQALQCREDANSIAAGRPRCRPSATSPLSNALSSEDVEAFLSQLLPHLRMVRDMPPWMRPYYLCHATRKFFFMSDPRGTGSIAIDDFMSSEVFSELLRIYESDLRDAVVVYPIGSFVQVPTSIVVAAWRLQAAGGDEAVANVDASVANDDDCIDGVVTAVEGDGNNLSDVYTVQIEFRATTVQIESSREHIHWSPLSSDASVGLGQNGGPDDQLRENWFSLRVMNRVYEHFTELDVDADGVLTVDEFKRYSNSSFTELAMTRVFECHVPRSATMSVEEGEVDKKREDDAPQQQTTEEATKEEDAHDAGEETQAQQQQQTPTPTTVRVMDYKTFLNFVLGSELPHTIPGAKYLWRLINLDDGDQVPLSYLRFFAKDIAEQLIVNGLMTDISVDSIMSEVVDMINPSDHEGGITFNDLVRSNQCATVLPILVNFRNFYAYDCREHNIVQAADTQEFLTNP